MSMRLLGRDQGFWIRVRALGGLGCFVGVLVAFGFGNQGKKRALGIRESSAEKAKMVRAPLSGVIDRSLHANVPQLC